MKTLIHMRTNRTMMAGNRSRGKLRSKGKKNSNVNISLAVIFFNICKICSLRFSYFENQ